MLDNMIFKLRVPEGDYRILYRIHPLMQRPVHELLKSMQVYKNIRIIVFGSSLTWSCHNDSDLDIAIEFLDDSNNQNDVYWTIVNTLKDYCDYDIIWYNTLSEDSLLKQEIDTNGFAIRSV